MVPMAVAISAAAAQLECAFSLPSNCNSCVPKTALETWKDHANWTILVSIPVGKLQGVTLLLDKLLVIFFHNHKSFFLVNSHYCKKYPLKLMDKLKNLPL